MKILVYFTFLMIYSLNAQARIGWTEKQCDDYYGEAIDTVRYPTHVEKIYIVGKWSLIAEITPSGCVQITYQKAVWDKLRKEAKLFPITKSEALSIAQKNRPTNWTESNLSNIDGGDKYAFAFHNGDPSGPGNSFAVLTCDKDFRCLRIYVKETFKLSKVAIKEPKKDQNPPK